MLKSGDIFVWEGKEYVVPYVSERIINNYRKYVRGSWMYKEEWIPLKFLQYMVLGRQTRVREDGSECYDYYGGLFFRIKNNEVVYFENNKHRINRELKELVKRAILKENYDEIQETKRKCLGNQSESKSVGILQGLKQMFTS